jgi:hypothetical protein
MSNDVVMDLKSKKSKKKNQDQKPVQGVNEGVLFVAPSYGIIQERSNMDVGNEPEERGDEEKRERKERKKERKMKKLAENSGVVVSTGESRDLIYGVSHDDEEVLVCSWRQGTSKEEEERKE